MVKLELPSDSCSRNGDLTIDFRFTSKFSDLQSGKLKLTSESPEAVEAIKRILAIMPFWRVLSAEDLNTQEGKTFWMFCPLVCYKFVTELIRAHTGWFLEGKKPFMLHLPIKQSSTLLHVLQMEDLPTIILAAPHSYPANRIKYAWC